MGEWSYILYETFSGEAGALIEEADSASEDVKASFAAMRYVVGIGWSIYLLGYLFRYLTGSVEAEVQRRSSDRCCTSGRSSNGQAVDRSINRPSVRRPTARFWLLWKYHETVRFSFESWRSFQKLTSAV